MKENAKKMKCGACGAEVFGIYLTEGSKGHPKELVCECLACKSTFTLRVTIPTIEVGWGENSDGVLTVF